MKTALFHIQNGRLVKGGDLSKGIVQSLSSVFRDVASRDILSRKSGPRILQCSSGLSFVGLAQSKKGMLNLSLGHSPRKNPFPTPFWSLSFRQTGLRTDRFKGLVLTSVRGLRSREHILTREDEPSLAHLTGALSPWERGKHLNRESQTCIIKSCPLILPPLTPWLSPLSNI